MNDPIIWTGDLDDDCCAEWHGLFAHAEQLDEYRWYCSVYDRNLPLGDQQLFHSEGDDIIPRTGRSARRLAELVMRTMRKE